MPFVFAPAFVFAFVFVFVLAFVFVFVFVLAFVFVFLRVSALRDQSCAARRRNRFWRDG